MFDLSTQFTAERINTSFVPVVYYARCAARLVQSRLDAAEYILTYTTRVARTDGWTSYTVPYIRSVTSTVYIFIVGDVHYGLMKHFDSYV